MANGLILEREHCAHWELGSEFHWVGSPQPPLIEWPDPAAWFMLARHAVARLVQLRSAHRTTLWLPSYFCPEVAECCRLNCDCCIREYRDLPQWSEPDWTSLQPHADDIVLALNYFGVRDGEPWKRWRRDNPCVLLEDHSQDPFSRWALTSTAEFAFASVRKTVPVADGAILWSPLGLALPEPPGDGDWSGVALKVAAMIYKTEYLSCGTPSLKERFRELQLRGEALMRKSRLSAISPASFAYVANGTPRGWRQQRADNTHHLVDNLKQSDYVRPLFHCWPDGAAPFALPIEFPSQRQRDACQAALRENRIYCPVHWVCQTVDAEARSLSVRILSLPVDQRYARGDMDLICRVIHNAKMNQVCDEDDTE